MRQSLVLLAVFLGLSVRYARTQPPEQEVVEKEDDGHVHMLIGYNGQKGRSKLESLSKLQVIHDFHEDSYVSAIVSFEEKDELLEYLELDPDVGSVEDDHILTEQGVFEGVHSVLSERRNLRRELQELVPYGVKMVQADQVLVGPYNVSVCVVDTGVARGHPDLDFGRLHGANRTSNIDGSYLVWDVDMRGLADNNIGVRGMGKIKVFFTRGLNNLGRARESDVLDAMEQCETAGAKVIGLSLSGRRISRAMESILDRLYSKGFLIFAAAGNFGSNVPAFPAAHRSVVSVTAVTELEERWAGANYGNWIELAGPGSQITSTGYSPELGYIYSNYSGTSMATPHVAGAAAILWSHHPECTNTQIRYAMAYTAKGVAGHDCDDNLGYGIVQVESALKFLSSHTCEGSMWGQTDPAENCTSIDIPPIDHSWYRPWSWVTSTSQQPNWWSHTLP